MRAVALSTSGSTTGIVVKEDTEELFNWAEKTFPEFFPGGRQPNQFSAPYDFRFYPLTGNYAGVANGRVYTFGPMNNGGLVDHGTVESFACLFKPDRCSAPGMLTSVPMPTYPAGSDELAVFNYLNKERARCGFGMMAQNTLLDRAAKNHFDYTVLNHPRPSCHYQTPGLPGFTGVNPIDRTTALGYQLVGGTFVSESLVGQIFNYAPNDRTRFNDNSAPLSNMKILLNAPYHALDLISNHKETGIGYGEFNQKKTEWYDSFQNFLVVKLARVKFSSTEQDLTSNSVRTDPCQGSTDVVRILNGENPNPVTPRNLGTNPIGSSVMVKVRTGNTLLITSASMNNAATGEPVVLLPPLTRANDQNSRLQTNAAVIMADKPMSAATEYNVSISGTNNGVAFQRSFKFKTMRNR